MTGAGDLIYHGSHAFAKVQSFQNYVNPNIVSISFMLNLCKVISRVNNILFVNNILVEQEDNCAEKIFIV